MDVSCVYSTYSVSDLIELVHLISCIVPRLCAHVSQLLYHVRLSLLDAVPLTLSTQYVPSIRILLSDISSLLEPDFSDKE